MEKPEPSRIQTRCPNHVEAVVVDCRIVWAANFKSCWKTASGIRRRAAQ